MNESSIGVRLQRPHPIQYATMSGDQYTVPVSICRSTIDRTTQTNVIDVRILMIIRWMKSDSVRLIQTHYPHIFDTKMSVSNVYVENYSVSVPHLTAPLTQYLIRIRQPMYTVMNIRSVSA